MLVKELLLDILDDLGSDDFQKFNWYLSLAVLENCQPIPKSRLENGRRTDTVNRMVESYRPEVAVNVAVEILRKMGNNLAADGLKCRYRGETVRPHATNIRDFPVFFIFAILIL